MGKLVLYGLDASPPVRSVLLTLNALGLPFDFKEVNLLAGENQTAEYLAKNPSGTVPALEDDGVFIGDSHAINAYLVSKYGKDDSLYPKDYPKRAAVDERLYYEAGSVFFGALRNITYDLFFHNVTDVPQAKIDNIQKVYATVETYLQKHNYIASDQLTIADFSLVTTITSATALLDIDAGKYPKVIAWIKRLEKLPYFKEANTVGVQKLHAMIKSKNVTIVP